MNNFHIHTILFDGRILCSLHDGVLRARSLQCIESLPSIRQMKKEQSMIVQKVVEGRDVLQNNFAKKSCLAFVKLLQRPGGKKNETGLHRLQR